MNPAQVLARLEANPVLATYARSLEIGPDVEGEYDEEPELDDSKKVFWSAILAWAGGLSRLEHLHINVPSRDTADADSLVLPAGAFSEAQHFYACVTCLSLPSRLMKGMSSLEWVYFSTGRQAPGVPLEHFWPADSPSNSRSLKTILFGQCHISPSAVRQLVETSATTLSTIEGYATPELSGADSEFALKRATLFVSVAFLPLIFLDHSSSPTA